MIAFMLLLFSGQMAATAALISMAVWLSTQPETDDLPQAAAPKDPDFRPGIEAEPIAMYSATKS